MQVGHPTVAVGGRAGGEGTGTHAGASAATVEDGRGAMKIDTGLGAELSSVADRVAAAEAAGLDCVWAAETTNDPFLSLTLAAEHSDVRLARHGGRHRLRPQPDEPGLHDQPAAGVLGRARRAGDGVAGAPAHREALQLDVVAPGGPHAGVRARPAGHLGVVERRRRRTAGFEGDFYTHTLMTPVFAPKPHAFGAPRVFLAAVGPSHERGGRRGGRRRHHPRHLHGALPARGDRAGAGAGPGDVGAGRGAIEVTCPGFISVVEDASKMEKARDAMRRQVGYYASTPAYRPVLDLHGWGDLQTELYACSKSGRWDDMARLVDDEVLDTLTIVCPPDGLAGRGGRPLRRAGRPHQRLVVAQGVVARRREGAARTVSELDAKGFAAPGFERVAETLGRGASVIVGERERRADLGDGGGAFCAFVDGECVVDVWTGPAGPGRPWEEDTRAVIMSSTKGMTTLCAHLLEDRGELDLDAPVVAVLARVRAAPARSAPPCASCSATSPGAIGLPGSDELLSWDGRGWDDTVAIAAARGRGAPAWEPGTRHGYHGVTFGWLVGELVRRISGASLGAFFEAEVAQPLGVACSIGTPASELPDRGHRHGVPGQPGKESALRAIDPESKSGRSVLAGAHGSLFADEQGRPRFADFMNTPAVLAAEIGALGATATARALARIYAALAVGEELVSRASVERFRTEQVCGRDAVMGVPTRWAVGYSLEPPALVPGVPPMHGPERGRLRPHGRRRPDRLRRPRGARRLWLRAQPPGEPGAPAHGRLPGGRALLVPAGRRERGRRCTQLTTRQQHPDQPAIVMAPSGRTLTFAEYEAAANQVAHLLRDSGLRRQDHMAIFMENDPAMLLTEAGAERTGLYFTPVNSYLSAEEVAYVVNDSQSRVVVTSAAKAEVAAAAPGAVPRRSSAGSWSDADGQRPAARSSPGKRPSARNRRVMWPTSRWARP